MAACGLLMAAAAGRAADEAVVKWEAGFRKDVQPILESRCFRCHSGDKVEGELDLAKVAAAADLLGTASVWDRVAPRIRLGEMPPAGSPGLSDPEKATLQRWLDSRPGRDLCSQLASDETKSWYHGRVMSRRLTRSEYDRIVSALFRTELRPSTSFPSDGAGGEGFDTTGDTLFTSPIHVERYLVAAADVVDRFLVTKRPTDPSLVAGWERWVGPDFAAAGREGVRRRLADFVDEAWRRPPTPAELDALGDLAAAEATDPLAGMREAFTAVLASPHFLFIVEPSPGGDGVKPLTPRQLATRLSLFLWSSLPDAPLLAVAADGRLTDEAVLREQVRRMLADERSRGLAEDFGMQWLDLRNFAQRVVPDPAVFPEFDAALAADVREEVVRVVHRVFRDDRSLSELIDAARTPLTPRLAAHYGLSVPPESAADAWVEVSLPDRRRGGVLTTAAVLAGTSYPRRTSPVLRGQWVLGQMLGAKVPPPPPGVPPLDEAAAVATARTLRQRLEAHRADPSCASCHDRMDPLGFGLENYDAIGRWRTEDAGQPIDASGSLAPQGAFDGPEELKSRLLARQGDFQRSLARKLLGYALGRGLDEFDQCVVDRALEQLAAADNRAGVLVEEIVVSYPFRHRYHKSTAARATP
ncbi:MAG: DUF1592 domain-containing protein [Planctomycetia bacterium]